MLRVRTFVFSRKPTVFKLKKSLESYSNSYFSKCFRSDSTLYSFIPGRSVHSWNMDSVITLECIKSVVNLLFSSSCSRFLSKDCSSSFLTAVWYGANLLPIVDWFKIIVLVFYGSLVVQYLLLFWPPRSRSSVYLEINCHTQNHFIIECCIINYFTYYVPLT